MMHEHTPCQCDVCKVSHFERNNYFHGKTLSARDLSDEQAYFNEKRWLINRMVLGWGVVCGLDACQENGCIVVRPGLAIDCCGHELLVCTELKLHADKFAEALPAPGTGGYPTRPPAKPPTGPYAPSKPTPSGSYGQTPAAPEYPQPPGGYPPPPDYPRPPDYPKPPDYPEPEPEPVRWVLCLEYRTCKTEPVKLPATSHSNGREYNRIRDDYRLSIRAWKDACAEDHTVDRCPHERLGRATPLHQALVSKSLKCPACEDCECVVLATGTLETKAGEVSVALDDDHWKYRRIVYTNSTLADLLRCFHGGFPHIESINWTPGAHYQADEFLDRLSQEHLKVTFDQPMKPRTVTNVRSCRLSVFAPNAEGNCPVPLLIPVDRIEYHDRTATYYFDDDCIEHELRRACKRLRKPVDVELILHGSMVHNREGRALDAELIDDFPTGNGVEGGEFVAYFTVGPHKSES